MSKDKFVEFVKIDLNLKTNEEFEKAVERQVDFNYGELVRGINKVYRQENQNLKPNTIDPASIYGGDTLNLSVGKFQEKFMPVLSINSLHPI